ncbi:hypothetical protein DQW77_12770 [Roseovarius sp. TE539]|uniref:hypothetical protein n=1 Tax=Roseovarius sp. TE539 TaxID=2249812 RepID=UPI000DDC5165|nr:hypothetical protein [Roseovarius sp. TE539]RBI71138.1 hypothetical protein DQW77_12770 [Roseovarius sp. TE539]
MTPISHLLEDFGAAAGATLSMTDVKLEEQKLESFETGYTAGWEDAAKAQADDATRISADFARNLQELSFTYQEAHAQVLDALTPLLEGMVETVLPDLARRTLAPRLVDMVQEKARSLTGSTRFEIVVAPACRAALEPLLEGVVSPPVTLREEPSLGEGQAYIAAGDTETEIDLDEVLAGIGEAVAGFLEDQKRETG